MVLISGTGHNTRDEDVWGHKVFLILADALTARVSLFSATISVASAALQAITTQQPRLISLLMPRRP